MVDSESLAAAIRACRNGGEWQQAVALSRDVEDRGLDGTLTYSALMGAYALNAMWEEAFNLLDILQRSKAGQPILQSLEKSKMLYVTMEFKNGSPES